jgi:hypothetical protein
LFLGLSCIPHPSPGSARRQHADYRLTTRLHGHALDPNHLLRSLASLPVERTQQFGEGPRRVRRGLVITLCYLEGLVRGHRAAGTLHSCVVHCHRLRSEHAFDFVSGLKGRQPADHRRHKLVARFIGDALREPASAQGGIGDLVVEPIVERSADCL